MGKLHHAMTGTGAVAVAVASVIPGTVVHRLLANKTSLDPNRHRGVDTL
jgi:2-methylaconitate isomerase